MFLEPSSSPLHARHRRRGFTLIELVVVVVIIGICAALATPSVITQMRERRSRDLAQRIGALYSNARMRAMGRGAAVLVRYDQTKASFSVLQSIEGAVAATARDQADCAMQPGLGCSTNNWNDVTLYQEIESLPLDKDNYAFRAKVGTAEPATMDICYSALGRSFITLTGDAYLRTPMVNPSTFELRRVATGGTATSDDLRGNVGNLGADGKYWRTVVILPNGTARLSL